MSIRPAAFADIPRLIVLMQEAHGRSKYKGRDAVDVAEAKTLLVGALQRHSVKGPGGCCAFVAEQEGVVEGYIIGILERVYQVGTKLWATDFQFVVSERADKRDFIRLFDAFEDWAEDNPRVIEIKPGVTNIIDDPERLAAFYERRGYKRCGLIFERSL